MLKKVTVCDIIFLFFYEGWLKAEYLDRTRDFRLQIAARGYFYIEWKASIRMREHKTFKWRVAFMAAIYIIFICSPPACQDPCVVPWTHVASYKAPGADGLSG